MFLRTDNTFKFTIVIYKIAEEDRLKFLEEFHSQDKFLNGENPLIKLTPKKESKGSSLGDINLSL